MAQGEIPWLKQYEQIAPWDAARLGVACLSVSVQRVFQAEVARANCQHRVTLFLDLTTFFETVSHDRLAKLQFPATLLNIALQVYRGARILEAASCQSPPAYPTQGVVAGCPIAPCLSKLALHKNSLGEEQLQLSMKKSAFVCTDKETEQRLKKLLTGRTSPNSCS